MNVSLYRTILNTLWRLAVGM